MHGFYDEKLLILDMFLFQLYMAPVTHSDRYSESIDFWRDVYGIDSKSTNTNPFLMRT